MYQFFLRPSEASAVPASNRNPNALPVFIQIAELLIRDIAAGRLIEGERLPPEREMAAELNVSVGTLRKSLSELEQKGMLERIQGSGNYIRETGTQNSVYAMFRLELPEGGGLPRADILSVDHLKKPVELPVLKLVVVPVPLVLRVSIGRREPEAQRHRLLRHDGPTGATLDGPPGAAVPFATA